MCTLWVSELGSSISAIFMMSDCCQLLKTIVVPILVFVLVQRVVFPFLRILLNHLIFARKRSLRPRLCTFGSWAVVTGATDGIGKAYANLLAKDGLNIVLVSRTPEKLKDAATELESIYHVQTKTVAVDFSQLNIYEKLEHELSGLDIACLVNNVGVGYPHPNYFAGPNAFNASIFDGMLHTNCTSMVHMTRLVLPSLLRTGGAIINIASSAGLQPSPFLAVYSATKAFAITFSRSIAQEVADMRARGISGASKGSTVTIQTVTPMFVATKLSRIRTASFFAPSPMEYADQALNLLGVEDFTVGCLSHALQNLLLSALPTCLAEIMLAKIMRSRMLTALKRVAAKDK